MGLLWLVACSLEVAPAPAPIDPSGPGAWRVAHAARAASSGGRELTVELWYPTDEAPTEPELIPDAFYVDPERGQYAELLAAADPACPTAVEPARRDAPPAEGRWPLVVASHCTGCTRFDLMTVAERLASHGVVVAAPDHAGDTLQDDLAGTSLPLDTETLALRRDDLTAVLDAALDGAWVDGLTFDADRVGALGHSFGSVTAGLLAQGDPRIRAVMGIAAPMENPLLPGVEVATLTTPLLLLVAQEDHSIFEIGNELIRDNWASAGGPAWKVELPDAGHWSVSDLCGLTAGFMPCCGDAERQVGGAPFTYGDPAALRDRTATVAAAFFLDRFEIAPGALDDLGAESR